MKIILIILIIILTISCSDEREPIGTPWDYKFVEFSFDKLLYSDIDINFEIYDIIIQNKIRHASTIHFLFPSTHEINIHYKIHNFIGFPDSARYRDYFSYWIYNNSFLIYNDRSPIESDTLKIFYKNEIDKVFLNIENKTYHNKLYDFRDTVHIDFPEFDYDASYSVISYAINQKTYNRINILNNHKMIYDGSLNYSFNEIRSALSDNYTRQDSILILAEVKFLKIQPMEIENKKVLILNEILYPLNIQLSP
jgi:hypothetical protein